LDLGCAVGRTTLEMARWADESLGIDFSTRFIKVAYTLLSDKMLVWHVPLEGEIRQYREIKLALDQKDIKCEEDNSLLRLFGKEEDGWSLLSTIFGNDVIEKINENEQFRNITHGKIKFLQGDACNLKEVNQFECIVAANLIDRLYSPSDFLDSIGSKIVQGGFLILLSPYTWLREYTDISKWIGGKRVNGEILTTTEGLKSVLSKEFEFLSKQQLRKEVRESLSLTSSFKLTKDHHFLIHPEDMKDETECFRIPFVIRETQNKHQCTFSVVTVWRKK